MSKRARPPTPLTELPPGDSTEARAAEVLRKLGEPAPFGALRARRTLERIRDRVEVPERRRWWRWAPLVATGAIAAVVVAARLSSPSVTPTPAGEMPRLLVLEGAAESRDQKVTLRNGRVLVQTSGTVATIEVPGAARVMVRERSVAEVRVVRSRVVVSAFSGSVRVEWSASPVHELLAGRSLSPDGETTIEPAKAAEVERILRNGPEPPSVPPAPLPPAPPSLSATPSPTEPARSALTARAKAVVAIAQPIRHVTLPAAQPTAPPEPPDEPMPAPAPPPQVDPVPSMQPPPVVAPATPRAPTSAPSAPASSPPSVPAPSSPPSLPAPSSPPSVPAPSSPPSVPAPSSPPSVPAPSSPPPTSALAVESASFQRAVRALRHDKDPKAALRAVDSYLAAWPSGLFHAEAMVARVEALLALGRRAEARNALDRLAPSSLPRGRELSVIRGELRAEAGRCNDADRDFAVALDGTDELAERALVGRANCRAHSHDDARARAGLEEYLRRFPNGRFADGAHRALSR
jgi:hypothetical protein